MNDKMKNLVVRTLSGLVLVAVMLGAMIWSPNGFGVLLAVLAAAGMLEFYALPRPRVLGPSAFWARYWGWLFFVLRSCLPFLMGAMCWTIGGYVP